MPNIVKTLVAIPAYNEQETLPAVIADIQQCYPAYHILVVDDGSVDDTATVAKTAGVTVVTLPFNVGVGGAMRTAFLYAQDKQYDAVVQVDADGQHNPEEINALCAKLTEADVVVGARFTEENPTYRVSGPRKWAMVILSAILSKVVGTKLSDTTSGFRASGPRAIDLFARHYPSEYLGDTVESLLIAHKSGLVITQVPANMRTRQGGNASQNTLRAVLYLGRAFLALGVALTRRNVTAGGE